MSNHYDSGEGVDDEPISSEEQAKRDKITAIQNPREREQAAREYAKKYK